MITTLISFILVIGILIFVHEFGHFIVAKKTGVEVEKFSLGFGPKIIGFKKGETHYMISAIPLGGYVKLKGENPDEPLTNDPKEFSSRSVGVRGAIVSAGPIMNILLAFLFMPFVYFIGIEIPAFLEKKPVVYWVAENSPAKAADFQVGDQMLAVDGEEVDNWEMFNMQTILKSGKEAKIRIKRNNIINEKSIIFNATIPSAEAIGIFYKMDAKIEGLLKGSPAQLAGLEPGDVIREINNVPITHWVGMSEIITKHSGKEITLMVERNGKTLTIKLIPDAIVEHIEREAPAYRAGIKAGDTIKTVNGKDISLWEEELLENGSFIEEELLFDIIRGGKQKTIKVIPQDKTTIGLQLAGKIGITPQVERIFKRYGVVASIKEGFKETISKIGLTFWVLGKLVTFNLSMKTLGGPIIIAKMSGAAAKSGISLLLSFIALLSINLGILNLLPIPVLDGGHLFFMLIELIMRKPLSAKKMELAQKIGFALLMILILTVTYNDILKVIPQKYLDFLPW